MTTTISDIGEKRMIKEFITPLFNPSNDYEGIGDDCGVIQISGRETWLFSTDRVPADLIAFRIGIIDHYGLGKYLAWLNISDIAACGGKPIALLLNLGLPKNLSYKNFQELCKGFKDAAEEFECIVIGGDMSSSRELSISATSIGKVPTNDILLRRGARAGDLIFVSKPIGLTPGAFAYHLRCCNNKQLKISIDEIRMLNSQFSSVLPLVSLGVKLSRSNKCTSCMDNTDGLGNSLEELSIASSKSFVIQKEKVKLPKVIVKIAEYLGDDPLEMAFGAGADFSLVGTINGNVNEKKIETLFGNNVHVIGYVEDGHGVFLDSDGERKPLKYSKWNYFSSEENANQNSTKDKNLHIL